MRRLGSPTMQPRRRPLRRLGGPEGAPGTSPREGTSGAQGTVRERAGAVGSSPPQRSHHGVPRRLHGARGGAASAAHPSPSRERQSNFSAMGTPPGLFPFLVSSQSHGRNPSRYVHSNKPGSFSFRHSLFLPIDRCPRRPLNYPRHLSTDHLQTHIFPHCDQTISNPVLRRCQGVPLGIPKRLWRPFR